MQTDFMLYKNNFFDFSHYIHVYKTNEQWKMHREPEENVRVI